MGMESRKPDYIRTNDFNTLFQSKECLSHKVETLISASCNRDSLSSCGADSPLLISFDYLGYGSTFADALSFHLNLSKLVFHYSVRIFLLNSLISS